MPLRAEYRHLYQSKAWQSLRLQLIEAAGGQICGKCGIELARGINGAHLDHNPRNPASVRLRCPACHARHDAPHRLAIMRRNRARATGQMWLTPEFEWAPAAAWEIPGWIYDRLAQLRLFQAE